MNKEYRYQLESKRLTGHQPRKITCPHCGKIKCFVRYVDTKNDFRYVDNNVGKCDHQHSCGYHYRPSEYYHDNQWMLEPAATLSNCKPTPPPPFQPLSMEYVLQSHSPHSIFWRWFSMDIAKKLNLSPELIQRVYNDYFIGTADKGDIIFWQIDHAGQVHGGHIMHYDFDGNREGYQNWTHKNLIKKGLLPHDWTLHQCFFGQHLLTHRPDAHVCLVESEKTAVIMAAYQPEYLWLATAGSGGLSPEKAKCLQGRRVTLFPDSGCYEKWSEQMKQTLGIDYNVSKSLEGYPPNTDLSDLLLGKV